jgi:hypothetical protein
MNAHADDLKSKVATLDDLLAITPISNDTNVARRRWIDAKKAVDDARAAYAKTSQEELGYFEDRAQHQKLANERAARLAAAAAEVTRAHDTQEVRRVDLVRAQERGADDE